MSNSFPYDASATAKRYAPAVLRNKDVILPALKRVLETVPALLANTPTELRLLELGSGTGEHAAHFARSLVQWKYHPSDVSQEALRSIDAHAAEAGLNNLAPALRIDLGAMDWKIDSEVHAAFCANVIHIAPPAVTAGLLTGVGRCLAGGGAFALYGPFSFGGVLTPESNVQFDAWLKAKDPRFGVRSKERVVELAEQHGLHLEEVLTMPANNHCLVFRKGAQQRP